MANYEFEIPGSHEPCRKFVFEEGYCLNTQRAIEFVAANSGKKLVCGRGHGIQHNGKVFVPAWEFDEGGAFEGILPDDLMPDQTRIKRTRWKIPSNAAIYGRALDECVNCESPPYKLYVEQDPAQALQWLQLYARDLIALIIQQLQESPPYNWYTRIDPKLRKQIVERLTLSQLAVDHGVPRKVGDRLWLLLSATERAFLQQSFLLRLCRRCNGAKASKLLPREVLERLFVATYYEGSVGAARQDSVRWTLLYNILNMAYKDEALA